MMSVAMASTQDGSDSSCSLMAEKHSRAETTTSGILVASLVEFSFLGGPSLRLDSMGIMFSI